MVTVNEVTALERQGEAKMVEVTDVTEMEQVQGGGTGGVVVGLTVGIFVGGPIIGAFVGSIVGGHLIKD